VVVIGSEYWRNEAVARDSIFSGAPARRNPGKKRLRLPPFRHGVMARRQSASHFQGEITR
jgi:hypothetical protein